MAEAPARTALAGIIFDTDVVVWYFRGNAAAQSFIRNLAREQRALSSLTMMELIQGCRNRVEMRAIKRFAFANISTVIHPDESISQTAIALLETYAAAHGLRVVDALIAATALESGLPLATANVRHYRAITRLELIAFRPAPSRVP